MRGEHLAERGDLDRVSHDGAVGFVVERSAVAGLGVDPALNSSSDHVVMLSVPALRFDQYFPASRAPGSRQ
ncbi:hypothetical protein ACWDHW_41380, partial [Streptomyces melanosporofaciens]